MIMREQLIMILSLKFWLKQWINFWPDYSGSNSDVLVITKISKLVLPEKYVLCFEYFEYQKQDGN